MGQVDQGSNGAEQALIIEDFPPPPHLDFRAPAPPGATLFQGSVSTINILLGVGLLSLPFAMARSGTAGLLSVALCCFLFCTTGKFISWGLDLMPADMPQDYPSLGEAALGLLGRRLVSISAAAELFGASCMMIIILWRSTEQLLPPFLEAHMPSGVTLSSVSIVLGIIIEVPLCVFGSYRSLSFFSAAGCMSTAFVMALVMMLPLLDPHKQCLREASSHHTISVGIIPATSIFALSVAGHSTFPSVRASMKDKAAFTSALNIAYIACAAVSMTICGIGYWYWGDDAHVLVTDDFERHSPYQTYVFLGVGIQKLVEALVAVNVATTTPLFVFAFTDIIAASVSPALGDGRSAMRPASEVGLRTLLITGVIGLSLATRDVLASVERVAGAVCVISSSLLLPTCFYVALRHQKGLMRPWQWLTAALIGAFCLGLMGVVLWGTAWQLVQWLDGAPDHTSLHIHESHIYAFPSLAFLGQA